MIFLKVILASFFLTGGSVIQEKGPNEYDLINFLACNLTYESLGKNLISWRNNSYESLNPINSKSRLDESFDMNQIFNEDQRNKIDEFLNSNHPSKMDADSINCKIEFEDATEFVAKKVIFSYSYPIISEGIDKEIYGIILESEVFEINYTLRLKVFKKQNESWDLVYQEDLAFS
ncbi:hypothetical protein [Algoriphagus litoralis]|uniref:hypothetical protein n=1 Tax=Algoriphagus litoralis TaxID=2202829 RepID=UPI000DB97E20|nr:hypothetical protein [Algoriphagus litoralis]